MRAAEAAALVACLLASFVASGEPGPAGVKLSAYGAACNGRADDTAAIARGLADAKARNVALLIPTGQCNFSDIIRMDSVKLSGTGTGSVLYATNWQRSAIFMYGAAPSVSNVKLTGAPAPSRQAPWEMTKITIFGASDFVIDHVYIEGSGAAGIQTAQAPTRGHITNNTVRNTLSDSIHITGAASYITIDNNLVEYSGDDGIAVVSYMSETGRVNNITARNNTVRNNRFGRNMSVVGGSQVLYQNNLLQDNLAGLACLYIAQEAGALATQGNDDVKLEHNTLENCGARFSGHAAVMMFSDGIQPNNRILLLGNDIRQARHAGIRVYSPWNFGVRIEGNRVTGASVALDVSSPSASVIPYTSGPVGYTSAGS